MATNTADPVRTRALILAAGVGRRLTIGTDAPHEGPKALLEFAGASLMARHIAASAPCRRDRHHRRGRL